MNVPSAPASKPIRAVCHKPTTIAANRLRPKKSVPNGYFRLGGCLARAASGYASLGLITSKPMTVKATSMSMINRPTDKLLLRRR